MPVFKSQHTEVRSLKEVCSLFNKCVEKKRPDETPQATLKHCFQTMYKNMGLTMQNV